MHDLQLVSFTRCRHHTTGAGLAPVRVTTPAPVATHDRRTRRHPSSEGNRRAAYRHCPSPPFRTGGPPGPGGALWTRTTDLGLIRTALSPPELMPRGIDGASEPSQLKSGRNKRTRDRTCPMPGIRPARRGLTGQETRPPTPPPPSPATPTPIPPSTPPLTATAPSACASASSPPSPVRPTWVIPMPPPGTPLRALLAWLAGASDAP